MLLQSLISEALIECNLKARTKITAIEELANMLLKENIITNLEDFISAVKRRENIESTGIGDGIAIPHARAKTVKKLTIALGKSKQGIDFNAIDGNKVKLIFLIAAPENIDKTYLQAIAKTMRFLKSKIIKKTIIKSKTQKEIMDIIIDFDRVLAEELKVETKEGRVIYSKKP